MKTLLITLAVVLSTVFSAQAGGSVDWTQDALSLLKKNPKLALIIDKTLEVAQNGTAIRLGKNFGDEQGRRVSPYQFAARMKGSKGPYDLVLIIHDVSGLHEVDDEQTWIEIRPKK